MTNPPIPMCDLTGRPLTSLPSVILTTGAFAFLWSLLRDYVARNGPLSLARPITRWNNRLYSLLSLLLVCMILNSVSHSRSHSPFHSDTPSPTYATTYIFEATHSELAYVYHLSKIWEYIDVFNLVASGTPIAPHMAFHHLTTPFLTYFRVLHASEWEVFAVLNAFHHFWMYAYFGGVGVFRPILPVTGWVQLVGGIAVDVLYLFKNRSGGQEGTNRAIAVLLLGRYAILFYEELATGRVRKEKETRGKGRNKE